MQLNTERLKPLLKGVLTVSEEDGWLRLYRFTEKQGNYYFEKTPDTFYPKTFAAAGINLNKLESCPIVGHDFEFIFFFELQASTRDEKTVAVLETLEKCTERMIFLGNYSEA